MTMTSGARRYGHGVHQMTGKRNSTVAAESSGYDCRAAENGSRRSVAASNQAPRTSIKDWDQGLGNS